ncbi:MAG: FHA domain-containing protein, partial [Planctomycetota bacterium]|nr:FHA domain-containing protein [Planctomycetota bacterium]
MTESSSENKVLVLRLGELCKPIAAGHSYTIGSSPECDLSVGHGSVSAVHCRLEVREGEVLVHDLNSAAGIKVEGKRAMDLVWAPGQVLEIGEIRAELEVTAPVLTLQEVAAAANKITAAHHTKEQEFGEIMLTQLKSAPWLLISAITHAVVLLLLWIFAQQKVEPGVENLALSLEQTEAEDEVEEDTAEVESVEETEVMEDTEFTETELLEAEELEIFKEEAAIYESGATDMSELLTNIKGTGLGDILKEAKGSLSGTFKKTIGSLRRNGLEIMFVFDSTGSMGSVLSAAKERITKMVAVLQELVPYARIGIITYRDEDKTEAYLTRDVVLSRDFYRAMNFLKGVYAGGGGDIPEAVYQALRKATSQKWNKSARRLIVLIGDAPPHKKTEGRISSMVKAFTRNGRSHVHAIVTRPSSEDRVSNDATRTFKRIARDGKGDALTFEDEGEILR